MSTAPSSAASKSSPRMPDGSRSSAKLADMGERTPEIKPHLQEFSNSGRYTSYSQPEHMQSLQSSSMMHLQDPSYATSGGTSRPIVYKQEENDDPPLPATLQHGESDAEAGMPNPMHYAYFEAPTTLSSSFSAPSALGPAQWPSFSSHFPVPDFGRSVYTTMPPTASYSSEAITGIPSAQLTYESPSSTNVSPTRTPNYYDMSSGAFSHSNHPQYAFHEGAPSSEGSMTNPYGMMPSPQFQGQDVEGMLEQVSQLYKNANTKKMAEFYRDKWARMWLSCNYTLKPSIQISIPRTILHESYRQACESFSVEPLQAASFGKVLRSQFPDVAQRRLGGRGKTRFHYCGFGTSTEREALKVKALLEDEKAGRLQLSAGMSSEFSSVSKAKAKSEGHDPSSSSSSNLMYEDAHTERAFSFASSSSQSSSSHHPQAKDLAASAFATLNSSTSTPSVESAGHHVSQSPQVHSQHHHQLQTSTSGQGGMIPRRHTVSHAQSFPNLPDMSFLSDMNFQPYPVQSTTGLLATAEHGYSSEGQTGDQSSFTSQLNSPASSLLGYTHGYSSQSPHQMRAQRSCRDLPDWPRVDESGQVRNTAAGSTTLSPNARKAWREYEALCQDMLHSVYRGPDLTFFEQRMISFWSNVPPSTHDALQGESLLSQIMLQADEIVFSQLLRHLNERVGKESQLEGMSSNEELSASLSNESGATTGARIRSSQNATESLERIAKMFEAVRAFRNDAMLDVGSYRQQASGVPSTTESVPSNIPPASVDEPLSVATPYPRTIQSLLPHDLMGSQYRQRDQSLGSNASDPYFGTPSEETYSSSASEHGHQWVAPP